MSDKGNSSSSSDVQKGNRNPAARFRVLDDRERGEVAVIIQPGCKRCQEEHSIQDFRPLHESKAVA